MPEKFKKTVAKVSIRIVVKKSLIILIILVNIF